MYFKVKCLSNKNGSNYFHYEYLQAKNENIVRQYIDYMTPYILVNIREVDCVEIKKKIGYSRFSRIRGDFLCLVKKEGV